MGRLFPRAREGIRQVARLAARGSKIKLLCAVRPETALGFRRNEDNKRGFSSWLRVPFDKGSGGWNVVGRTNRCSRNSPGLPILAKCKSKSRPSLYGNCAVYAFDLTLPTPQQLRDRTRDTSRRCHVRHFRQRFREDNVSLLRNRVGDSIQRSWIGIVARSVIQWVSI
jgi:hypothetical protein